MADDKDEGQYIPRYIPRKTRVKTEFAKGITTSDLFYGGVVFLLLLLTFFARGLPGGVWTQIGIAVAILLVAVIGFIKTGEQVRIYSMTWNYFKFIAYAKKFSKIPERGHRSIKELVPYKGIIEGRYIDYGDYYGMVMEIMPVEFGLLDMNKQNMMVNNFANALRRIGAGQAASLTRLERGMVLDRYIETETQKYESVLRNVENGGITEHELEAREVIFQERGLLLEYLNEEEKVFRSRYFLSVFDKDKDLLAATVSGIRNTLGSGAAYIEASVLETSELAIFLRANYTKEFDERDMEGMPEERYMDWIVPNKISFLTAGRKINTQQFGGMQIVDYPLDVGNAWGYRLFNMPATRTVLNFHMVNKLDAINIIDKAIIEMKSQMSNSGKSSYQMERNTQIETITNLLYQLKTGNEALYDVNINLVPELDMKKEVKAKLREDGYKFAELVGRQVDSYIATNVSRAQPILDYTRGMPTTTLAAAFPFISDMLQDEKGVCIGTNSYPVFIDFFKRNNVRVNSNMMIIGKSGSGKSFATKSILAHLAADNTKIFICDPEKEYAAMAENMHGNNIDVGNAGKGRFNPFHIYPAMEADEDEDDEEEGGDDVFESHLRFLESYFKIVMEGIRNDALETLNGLVAALYRMKGIDKYTDFGRMQPNQFPIFQELFGLARHYLDNSTDEFSKVNYRILVTYLEKFAEGGRYSGLWNGYASIRTNENFVCFNFMTLLANRNQIVANAQMLLTFKYLDGEIIKNRDYNNKHGTNRKIIIVVDEAHVFIDEQRPIALDFMFNMAKRIRKYGGMQIIITQNVKDFVGSPIIAKKSSAIINASQYSMIFSLAPNDMSDLVTLYKNAGGINKSEQEQIVGNARGQCFFVHGPMNRTLITIETSDEIQALFKKPGE